MKFNKLAKLKSLMAALSFLSELTHCVPGEYRKSVFLENIGNLSSWRILEICVPGEYRKSVFLENIGNLCYWRIQEICVCGECGNP